SRARFGDQGGMDLGRAAGLSLSADQARGGRSVRAGDEGLRALRRRLSIKVPAPALTGSVGTSGRSRTRHPYLFLLTAFLLGAIAPLALSALRLETLALIVFFARPPGF